MRGWYGQAMRGRVISVSAVVLWLTVAAAARAASLEDRVAPLIAAHKGQVAVAIKHLSSGETYRHRADATMPTASLIKFPVMVEAYRQAAEGRIALGDMLTVASADKAPGSGILTEHFSPGMQLSLRDAVRLMIAYSDNTATNMVIDRLGVGATAAAMDALGLPETKLHSKTFSRESSVFPERSEKYGLGSTTADETLRLYEMLHEEKLVSPEASRAMREHLAAVGERSTLLRYLPTGTKAASKGGAVSAVRCNAGIVESPAGPFVVCVFTSENEDQRWTRDNAGDELCARVAEAAYEHFTRGQSATPVPAETPAVDSPLGVGASGELVEALQRTLNARLDPSPELDVDGDFGEVTAAAVRRFQQQAELPVNGQVGAETWQALGPIATTERSLPDPGEVNSAVLGRAPADSLEGPPEVTCRAWAIGDAATGELLWGDNAARPLDNASTTKIMTALLVIELAEKDPGLLDEVVTFSIRADQTRGSTAAVRAGERLSVRELLYGLLLPSGNDASVALAEHVGGGFDPPEGKSADEADAVDRFVAEMNRRAAALGLSATHYANPHGLTAEGHQSSAADLLRLAHAARERPLFCEVVGTRQRGCTLTSESGYSRNIVWRNTNELLRIDGYDGVKTGTTDAAGACLVSCGQRGDDRLLVVVLGADSSDARYVDARNLFRWAWRQRAEGK